MTHHKQQKGSQALIKYAHTHTHTKCLLSPLPAWQDVMNPGRLCMVGNTVVADKPTPM